jgi:hypothetical protein
MMALKASTAMRAASKPLSTRAPGLAPVAESPSTSPEEDGAMEKEFSDLANEELARSANGDRGADDPLFQAPPYLAYRTDAI